MAGGAGGEKNVMGSSLSVCSLSPLTGWYRDGYCRTDSQVPQCTVSVWSYPRTAVQDRGSHTVCATMTAEFLQFTRSQVLLRPTALCSVEQDAW